jgi:hypothetical protein
VTGTCLARSPGLIIYAVCPFRIWAAGALAKEEEQVSDPPLSFTFGYDANWPCSLLLSFKLTEPGAVYGARACLCCLSLCLRLRLLASVEIIPLLVLAYVLIKSKDNESENRALINVLLVN